jgi:metal-responsive CopG/Arc/MetJ family transcriptional regulator
MAKVMVSLPDELLAELDAEAARRGTTRSALLRAFAQDAFSQRGAQRAARVTELARDATPHGGDVAGLVKRHRPQ